MRVAFTFPMGGDGWTRTAEVAAVPRVGDTVYSPDDNPLLVQKVCWYPFDVDALPEGAAAYVVLCTSETMRRREVLG